MKDSSNLETWWLTLRFGEQNENIWKMEYVCLFVSSSSKPSLKL